jgi:hypothetical protein
LVFLASWGWPKAKPFLIAVSNAMKRVFSADKTRAKLARTTRALLADIPAPFCRAEWPESSHAKTVGTAWLQWGVLRKHNVVGESLYSMHVRALKGLFERKSRENVEVRATQLLLALRVFAMRHDHLPSNLAELTPEVFPRVPLDDFDGKPMRYLPDMKLIYSVGTDLKDSHGQKAPGGGDLPFEIRF